MSRYVPDEITNQVKQGFSGPDASWFRGDSIDYVRERAVHRDAAIYEFLDPAGVRPLVEEHLEGTREPPPAALVAAQLRALVPDVPAAASAPGPPRPGRARAASPGRRPRSGRVAPGDHGAKSLAVGDLGPEPDQLLGQLRRADALGHEHLLGGPVLGLQIGAGDLQQGVHELLDRGPDAGADVQVHVGRVALQGEDVGAGDVARRGRSHRPGSRRRRSPAPRPPRSCRAPS